MGHRRGFLEWFLSSGDFCVLTAVLHLTPSMFWLLLLVKAGWHLRQSGGLIMVYASDLILH